jgi:hypothetical protein
MLTSSSWTPGSAPRVEVIGVQFLFEFAHECGLFVLQLAIGDAQGVPQLLQVGLQFVEDAGDVAAVP